MEIEIITLYVICDEFLRYMNRTDHPDSKMSDAEVLTTALVAMLYCCGNYAQARRWLGVPCYIPRMLSKSQFSRRLHRLQPWLIALFRLLAEQFKALNQEQVYAIDSFPMAVCDNYRIRRCRIYTNECYRGKIASKQRYFYGLKVHLMVTQQGQPVEFFLSPGSASDVAHLGIAITKTGATVLLANWLVAFLGAAGLLVLLAGLFVVTTLLTQALNGAAVAAVMAPIAIQAAQSAGADPTRYDDGRGLSCVYGLFDTARPCGERVGDGTGRL